MNPIAQLLFSAFMMACLCSMLIGAFIFTVEALTNKKLSMLTAKAEKLFIYGLLIGASGIAIEFLDRFIGAQILG